jgi:hypothetical protein
MSDKGIARAVGREVFGLAVRLTGLWVGYISGFSLVVNTVSQFTQTSVVLTSLVGLGVGVGLIVAADRLCSISYGRSEADVMGR